MSQVGSRVPRLEDPRLLTGRGTFADDVDRPGQLHLRVVRSTVAHGRLAGVDTTAAAALPGVVAVLEGAELDLPPIPVRLSPDRSRLEPYLQPVLARDRVRYVGEPVAAVVARDPYLAEDAAELVVVSYEELGPVLDAELATAPGAPELFDGQSNEVAELAMSFGDAEAAFASAAHVVSVDVAVGRQTAVPIETRGLVAEWSGGDLEVWGATKVPHFNRRVLADLLGIEAARIRMHRSDAGGGFGVRGELYPEDVLVVLLARTTGRPVKWVEDRAEHLVATNHSRDQRHLLSAAFGADGDLLGLRAEIWHDNGAYIRTHGLTVPELTASMLPGPYRMGAFEARVHVVVSNKTPCGTYRAPGRYETTFARERLLDAAALELAVDPIELRRQNLLGSDELPLARGLRALGTDVVLDPGDYPGLLDEAIAAAGYAAWQREAETASRAGRLVGTGCAVFLEKSGLGPYEQALARLSASGSLELATGGTSLGQGIETVLAQIAADHFGLPTSSVSVVAGDTGLLDDGLGSWASRSTVVGGGAVDIAAARLAQLSCERAAELLEADPADIRLTEGRAVVAGSPSRGVSLAELAARGADAPEGTGDREVGAAALVASARFEVEHMTYPYGVHLAQVEVDPETGQVRVLRYFVAYEVGRAVNPSTVEGQLVGGAVQGLGGALLEEAVYGPDGQPASATLIDYMLPFATEAPEVETLVSERFPAETNPLGLRGAGEGGLTACGAAVASAVGAALGSLGAPRRLPISPHDVWRLAADRVT